MDDPFLRYSCLLEVLILLTGLPLRAQLDDGSRVALELFDDPAELVQLGAGGHRQIFDQFDAHERILPTRAGPEFRPPAACPSRWRLPPTSQRPPTAAARRCGCSDGQRCAPGHDAGSAAG